MPRTTRLCLLGLCAAAAATAAVQGAAGAAEDDSSAPGLISGKDLLQLSLALGGRVDSNPEAVSTSSETEYDALATVGGNLVTTIDGLQRLSLQGSLQALDSNRDADRREILGGATLRYNRVAEIDSLVVDGQFTRSDNPNLLTGSLVVADVYRADARYEWNDERNRYALFCDAASTQFAGGIAGEPAADLDSTTSDVGVDYGRKIGEFDLLTLRLTGDWTAFRSTGVSQDNEGVNLLAGWASQFNAQDSWSLAAGAEARHYQPNALDPAYNGVSPTVRASLHRPWSEQGQLVLAVVEDLATSVFGNPAIISSANLDASHPLAEDWIGRLGCGGNQIRDTHSNAGVPKDLRTTLQARCGVTWHPLTSLTIDGGALYEYSRAHIAVDYRRVGGQLTLTEIF